MTNKDYSPSPRANVLHFTETFALELYVPDCKYFIHKQNVRFEVGGDREGQSYIHSARITFNGRLEKSFDFCEVDNFIELSSDFIFPHTQNGTAHINVVGSGKLGME